MSIQPQHWWAYAVLLIAGIAIGFGIWLVGKDLPLPAGSTSVNRGAVVAKAGGHSSVPVTRYLLTTLAMVLITGALLHLLFRPLSLPPVISEILAGIVLGPSLLGWIWPEAAAWIIPAKSVDPHALVATTIKGIAQLGVVLYMFLVGLTLNTEMLRKRSAAATAVSHASIVLPLVLGMLISLPLYPRFAPADVSFLAFSLFMGAAMSITAFPVLARILSDLQLDQTPLGSIAITCAAVDDVTAWCLIACVIGVAQAQSQYALQVLGGSVLFVTFVLLVARPVMLRCLNWSTDLQHPGLERQIMIGVLAVVLLAATATETIGIHSLFGAFLVGAALPANHSISRKLTERLTDATTLLLLPAFFAYTGMRTELNLLIGWENWFWCGAILLTAIVGKFGGTYVAARYVGLSHSDALALGTLMNTRGLMELVVMNIGLDLGIVSPVMFAMMVVMALVTTAMTVPILNCLPLLVETRRNQQPQPAV